MAQNFADLPGLQNVLLAQDPNAQIAHNAFLGIRFAGGPWGPGDRYIRLRILLTDAQNVPLPVPQYEVLDEPVTLADPVFSTSAQEIVQWLGRPLAIPPGINCIGPFVQGYLPKLPLCPTLSASYGCGTGRRSCCSTCGCS